MAKLILKKDSVAIMGYGFFYLKVLKRLLGTIKCYYDILNKVCVCIPSIRNTIYQSRLSRMSKRGKKEKSHIKSIKKAPLYIDG